MLKTLTKKLRSQSLSEMQTFQFKISYHGSEEGGESEDSEGENQELAQIDRERRRNCGLTPLATNQQHNQGTLSPAQLRRLRVLLDPAMDRHSSEEELERISRDFLQPVGEGCKWALHSRHADHSSTSSDDEVKDLCGSAVPEACMAASPSPVLFSASPPRSLRPLGRSQGRPVILTHLEQPVGPYRRHREQGRPSLDLEKMQQKMFLRKNCGGKARTIKIRTLTGSRPLPRYAYDPSIFAFRSLSTIPPRSPLTPPEEPPCA